MARANLVVAPAGATVSLENREDKVWNQEDLFWARDQDLLYEVSVKDLPLDKLLDPQRLPDFGVITIRYVPDRRCLELKSLKMYTLAYRDLGIFQENVVNCFLRDIVKASQPVRATVTGEFASRGGLSSKMVATFSRPEQGR